MTTNTQDTITDRELQLIRCEAMKFAKKRGIEWHDCLTSGYIGLMDAKSKFDPKRGFEFDTFAIHRIRGAIHDGLRRETLSRRKANTPKMPTVSIDAADYQFVSARPTMNEVDERDAVEHRTRKLTGRHKLVAKCLADGLSYKEAGQAIGCSESNVSLMVSRYIRPIMAADFNDQNHCNSDKSESCVC